MDQNRMRWDRLQIRRGLSALARARELGGGQGFYALQAAIVACHARAATPMKRSGRASQSFMPNSRPGALADHRAQPRGGGRHGRRPGGRARDRGRLAGEPALKNYHLLESVRGDLLCKLGRFTEARAAFEIAARLAGNTRERELLKRRIAEAADAASRSLISE
jgi:predicted RNA polymerase sigma factor